VFLGVVWPAALWCVIAFARLVSATFGGSKAVACASALIVFGGLSVGLGYVLATYEFG